MMEELKACPFCGSDDVEIDWWDNVMGEKHYLGHCKECDAKTGEYETEKEANMAWNWRDGVDGK